ncbi:MAG: hypothetical protein K1X64_06650 [Myxococcaceae bacterium]|nr:hypothetical protein [Myxococcaceae bacterium]
MALVSRSRIATRVDTLAQKMKAADVRTLTKPKPLPGYEGITPKVVTGSDARIDPHELNKLTKGLRKTNAAVVRAAYSKVRSGGTASIASLEGALNRAAYTLSHLPDEGKGIARSDVFTPGGKPKVDVGNVAAKLWTAVRRG